MRAVNAGLVLLCLGMAAASGCGEGPVPPPTSAAQVSERLQWALRLDGLYNGPMDGVFGPGSRRAAAAWQRRAGQPATGKLTPAERARLLARVDAADARLGLRPVTRDDAGIRVLLPCALVTLDRVEPPFVHYRAIRDSAVSVALISRAGDRADLAGVFYDLQRSAVPPTGYRQIRADHFVLMGTDADETVHAWAAAQQGTLKGFVLRWPAGDLARRDWVLARMRHSFTAITGTLP